MLWFSSQIGLLFVALAFVEGRRIAYKFAEKVEYELDDGKLRTSNFAALAKSRWWIHPATRTSEIIRRRLISFEWLATVS